MKKHYLLSVLFATFLIFLSFHGVQAQETASISGDELCGATATDKCTLSDIKVIAQKVLYTLITIGGAAVFIFISYRLLQSQLAVMGGNGGARMEAGKNIFGAFQGFFIVVVAGGLLLFALKVLGAQEWTTQLFRLFSDSFIPHAYAANEKLLPNPLSSNNLFDLILAIMNLVIKFFIYPAIIALWVWSGFQFVYSQGNPEGLKKAKSWILWTFLITVVIFTLQGFLMAFKNTAMKIAPQNAAFIQPDTQQPAVTRDPLAPADGQPGSACTTALGTTGIRAADLSCPPSRTDSYAGQPVTNCNGQKEGTACTVAGRAGTCTRSDSSESGGTFSCYATPVAGGRTLIGPGGSCRISVECEGTLNCVNGICK